MPMLGSKQEVVKTSAELYTRSYRALLKFLIFSNVLTLLLILCVTYLVFFRPEPNYYAAASNGMLFPLQPK